MARGWESKAIESQQDDVGRDERPTRAPLTPAAAEALERRRGLELTRARLVDELSRAARPAHRSALEGALAAVEAQLGAIESASPSGGRAGDTR